MTNGIHPDRRQIALGYVARAAEDLEKATRSRIRYMQLARKYGATYREIAFAVGVTDAAVRTLLNRHAVECSHCNDEVAAGELCPECGLYSAEDAD